PLRGPPGASGKDRCRMRPSDGRTGTPPDRTAVCPDGHRRGTGGHSGGYPGRALLNLFLFHFSASGRSENSARFRSPKREGSAAAKNPPLGILVKPQKCRHVKTPGLCGVLTPVFYRRQLV